MGLFRVESIIGRRTGQIPVDVLIRKGNNFIAGYAMQLNLLSEDGTFRKFERGNWSSLEKDYGNFVKIENEVRIFNLKKYRHDFWWRYRKSYDYRRVYL